MSCASALRLRDAIAREGARASWVQSVVTVWGELEGGASERERELYVPGEDLAETLGSRPRRLSEGEITDTSRALGAIRDAGR